MQRECAQIVSERDSVYVHVRVHIRIQIFLQKSEYSYSAYFGMNISEY